MAKRHQDENVVAKGRSNIKRKYNNGEESNDEARKNQQLKAKHEISKTNISGEKLSKKNENIS